MSKKGNKVNLNRIKGSSSDNEEIMRMIKVFGAVILVFLAFYFIFAIYNGDISFGSKEKEKEEVQIQNVEIVAGSILSRMEDEYYVLLFDFDGDYAVDCQSFYSLYNALGNTKLYLVDLGKKFNSSYVTEDRGSVRTDSIDSLKVMNPTLLKVKGGKVVESSFGMEEFASKRAELLEESKKEAE